MVSFPGICHRDRPSGRTSSVETSAAYSPPKPKIAVPASGGSARIAWWRRLEPSTCRSQGETVPGTVVRIRLDAARHPRWLALPIAAVMLVPAAGVLAQSPAADQGSGPAGHRRPLHDPRDLPVPASRGRRRGGRDDRHRGPLPDDARHGRPAEPPRGAHRGAGLPHRGAAAHELRRWCPDDAGHRGRPVARRGSREDRQHRGHQRLGGAGQPALVHHADRPGRGERHGGCGLADRLPGADRDGRALGGRPGAHRGRHRGALHPRAGHRAQPVHRLRHRHRLAGLPGGHRLRRRHRDRPQGARRDGHRGPGGCAHGLRAGRRCPGRVRRRAEVRGPAREAGRHGGHAAGRRG